MKVLFEVISGCLMLAIMAVGVFAILMAVIKVLLMMGQALF